MEVEGRRSCSLITLIILVIIGPIAYFAWSIFLNKGTLVLVQAAPFEVDIFFKDKLEKSEKCTENPCKIKQKAGQKVLLIKKDGYQPIEKFVEVRVGGQTILNLSLIRIAGLIEVKEFPEGGKKEEYKLIKDSKTKTQKLVEANDKYEKAIVFFPNEIKKPKIFSEKNMVLIVDANGAYTSGYKVNTYSKERTVMGGENLVNITGAKLSQSGKWLIYSSSDSDYLWLMDEGGNYKKTQIKTGIGQAIWTVNNALIFATVQQETLSGEKDDLGRSKMTLGEFSGKESFVFGLYSPDADYYSRIGRFAVKQAPRNFMVLANGKEFFFEADGKKYKVGL